VFFCSKPAALISPALCVLWVALFEKKAWVCYFGIKFMALIYIGQHFDVACVVNEFPRRPVSYFQ
jgi:hypothetical protein